MLLSLGTLFSWVIGGFPLYHLQLLARFHEIVDCSFMWIYFSCCQLKENNKRLHWYIYLATDTLKHFFFFWQRHFKAFPFYKMHNVCLRLKSPRIAIYYSVRQKSHSHSSLCSFTPDSGKSGIRQGDKVTNGNPIQSSRDRLNSSLNQLYTQKEAVLSQ